MSSNVGAAMELTSSNREHTPSLERHEPLWRRLVRKGMAAPLRAPPRVHPPCRIDGKTRAPPGRNEDRPRVAECVGRDAQRHEGRPWATEVPKAVEGRRCLQPPTIPVIPALACCHVPRVTGGGCSDGGGSTWRQGCVVAMARTRVESGGGGEHDEV